VEAEVAAGDDSDGGANAWTDVMAARPQAADRIVMILGYQLIAAASIDFLIRRYCTWRQSVMAPTV